MRLLLAVVRPFLLDRWDALAWLQGGGCTTRPIDQPLDVRHASPGRLHSSEGDHFHHQYARRNGAIALPHCDINQGRCTAAAADGLVRTVLSSVEAIHDGGPVPLQRKTNWIAAVFSRPCPVQLEGCGDIPSG